MGFGGGGAAAWAAGGDACPVLSKSAGSKLTSATLVAGGPTAGAMVLPTVILSASGLPVFSNGAAAVDGTAKVCPG